MPGIVLIVVAAWAASVWTAWAVLHGGRRSWEKEKP